VYGSKWRRVRAIVLKRDGFECQVRGPGCRGLAGEVDHIIPVLAGGALYDPANLRASCAWCNRHREAQSRKRQRKPSREW
jgi:5-methylcytosine-specific restriction enzyme A